MEIERILKEIAARFQENHVRYGLMGGYAVAIHGYPRTTIDLDFLVDRSDLLKVDEILRSLGYELAHRSEDVSQFVSRDKLCGEVDFIHAFRETSRRMLNDALPFRLFPDAPEVMVLRVEDVIGLKVQAIANAPHRRMQDLADIQQLMAAKSKSIDWTLIEEYFALFRMQDLLVELKAGRWQD